MQFRLDSYAHGINNTIQWIDGSFVEDKMSRENSEPNGTRGTKSVNRNYIASG